MSLLRTERRDGVLIVQFVHNQLIGEDLVFRVGRELLALADEAAAYEGKLLLNFQGVGSMSSAMISKFVILNARCQKLRVDFRMCNVPSELLTMLRDMLRDSTQHDAMDSANPYESPRADGRRPMSRAKSLLLGPLLSLSTVLFSAAFVTSTATIKPEQQWMQTTLVLSLAGLGFLFLGISFRLYQRARETP
jgi:hypothetical protein